MDSSEFAYILDFSGEQWTFVKVAIDKTHQLSTLRQMPVDIGFKLEDGGNLETFLYPNTEQLGWELPDVIRLSDLANEWHLIEDEKVLRYLLKAFVYSLSSELMDETGDLYIIIPYRWSYKNRQELRQLFSENSMELKLRFCGFINEGIALLSYWRNQMADVYSRNSRLVWLDGRLRDLKIWCYDWYEKLVDGQYEEIAELKTVAIIEQYALRESEAVSEEIEKAIEASTIGGDRPSSFILASGSESDLEIPLKILIERFDVERPYIQDERGAADILLLGAACWIDLLMGKGNCRTDKYQIIYDWAFGVQIDAERILEVAPSDIEPPVRVRRSLMVRGEFAAFPLNLYCYFAPFVNSGLPLASLRLEPKQESRTQRRLEIDVEIELLDRLQGKFSVNIKGQDSVDTVAFRVPALME